QHKEYQQSNRLDENLRIATLMRDGYQCTQCEKKNIQLDAHHIIFKEHGGKDTISNLLTLCRPCHRKVHQGKLSLDVEGASGFEDRIAQRTMQGKTYLYEKLSQIAQSPLVKGGRGVVSKAFGYQTSEYRKALDLPKRHDVDALCVATLTTGEVIPEDRENFYNIKFRPRQTRRQYHDLPRKGMGRVRYQVNCELSGFRKGDIVRVKGKWVKQINSIYSNGYLAFARVSGEPNSAQPKDCQLLQREQTVIWEKVV
ncbi:HNH endonuclease, partial [bacterium]|nr:HNH endonuclease [bacterium]